MKSFKVITVAVLLGGALLWAQAQSQSTGQKKEKHVITEDELVASRPADFKSSVEEPKKEGDEASAVAPKQAAEAEEPGPPSEETQAKIEKLKAQEADAQTTLDEYSAKMDKAETQEEKNAYGDVIVRMQSKIKDLRAQRDALEHPRPSEEGNEAAEQPKQEPPPQ